MSGEGGCRWKIKLPPKGNDFDVSQSCRTCLSQIYARYISNVLFLSDLNVVKTKPAKMSQILPEMNHFNEKRRHKIFKIRKVKLLSLRIMTSSHL